MKIITSGYPSMDRIIKVSQTPTVGETSIITNKNNTDVFFGGCSPNIAYNLSKLGVKAYPIMRVGRDFESIGYKDYLEKGNVSLDYVTKIEEEVTSFCYLLEDPDAEHTTIFYTGAQSGEYFKPLSDDIFIDADYAILTVGDTRDNMEFISKCKKHNVPIVFGMRSDENAFPRSLLIEILTSAEIIFMNELESKLIEKILGIHDVNELLSTGNAKVIVTTLGSKGSRYCTRDGCDIRNIPVCNCTVVDTTGSGDAYISGFMFGIIENRPLDECCMLGGTLSSFVIEAVGCSTNAPTKEALYERFELFNRGE